MFKSAVPSGQKPNFSVYTGTAVELYEKLWKTLFADLQRNNEPGMCFDRTLFNNFKILSCGKRR